MIAKTLGAAAVLALAGSAMAQSVATTDTSNGVKGHMDPDTAFEIRGGSGTTVKFNIGPNNSMDGPAFGDVSNVVLTINIAVLAGFPSGTPVTMTGVAWNVNQQAVGASWLSEMRLYFDDNVAPDASGLFLRPSATTSNNGNVAQNNIGGPIDLTDNAIPNIALPNGMLRLELFESYEDYEDAVDGLWLNPSSISVIIAEVVPAPSALGLLGVAGVAALGRKRR